MIWPRFKISYFHSLFTIPHWPHPWVPSIKCKLLHKESDVEGLIVKLEPVMSSRHEAGRHPALPLSHAAVAEEVIAVHHGQLIQEELDGALSPAVLWTLPLQTHATRKLGESAVTRGNTSAAVDRTCSSRCLMSCSWPRRAWLPCRMYEVDTIFSPRLKFSLFISVKETASRQH